MATVIDANVLAALFSKHHEDRRDSRIRGLIEETRTKRGRLIVPSPALAEFAVGARDEEIGFIIGQQIFQVALFDAKAALECGFLIRDLFSRGDKKDRHKIKFDLQILAIAKSSGVDRLITNDNQLRNRAGQLGIQGVDIFDLPVPPKELQRKLAFDDARQGA